jgi:hypothetical protein
MESEESGIDILAVMYLRTYSRRQVHSTPSATLHARSQFFQSNRRGYVPVSPFLVRTLSSFLRPQGPMASHDCAVRLYVAPGPCLVLFDLTRRWFLKDQRPS